jgi:hypothetical protein
VYSLEMPSSASASKKKKKASTSSDGPTPTKHKPGTVDAHDRVDNTLPKQWVTGINKSGRAVITSIYGGYQYRFKIVDEEGKQAKNYVECADDKRRCVPGTSTPRKCMRSWTRVAQTKTHVAHDPDHLDAWASMLRLSAAQLWSVWVLDVQNARTATRPTFRERARLVDDTISTFMKNVPDGKKARLTEADNATIRQAVDVR